MTPFFTPQTGYGLHLCAESGIRPASLAETSPFHVPEPSSGTVVALVLLIQQKFEEDWRKKKKKKRKQKQKQQKQKQKQQPQKKKARLPVKLNAAQIIAADLMMKQADGMDAKDRLKLAASLDGRKDNYLSELTDKAGVSSLPSFLSRRNQARRAHVAGSRLNGIRFYIPHIPPRWPELS